MPVARPFNGSLHKRSIFDFMDRCRDLPGIGVFDSPFPQEIDTSFSILQMTCLDQECDPKIYASPVNIEYVIIVSEVVPLLALLPYPNPQWHKSIQLSLSDCNA